MIFSHSTRAEKILYLISFLFIILSLTHIGWLFYDNNSETVPSEGGTYTEGAVGEVQFLNPLLAQSNTIDADITKLIYSGLTKYDSKTGDILPDLATYTVDTTKKKYTFTIKENAQWHDKTPVTADDVIFTYKDILQNPDFTNSLLQANFKDVVIEKTDERNILFTLKEPYYFFPTATTIGILPKHLWEGIPVENLDTSEINLAPIGSGPYKFSRIKENSNCQCMTIDLQYFPDFYSDKPKIAGIGFKIFTSYTTLLENLSSLDAVNNIPIEHLPVFTEDKRFQVFSFSLPKYVALFMNMASDKLSDGQIRTALFLATNKDYLLKLFPYTQRVDTPFLELKQSGWLYQFDREKAKGALFDAGWKLKESLTSNNAYLASKNLLAATYKITDPNNGASYTTNQDYVILRGTNPTSAKGIIVNDYTLQKFSPVKGTWSYVISNKLGNLKKGKNVYTVYYINQDNAKVLLDSMTITYTPTPPLSNTNKNAPLVENNNTNISQQKNTNTNQEILATINGNQNNTIAPVNSNVNQKIQEKPREVTIPKELENNIRYKDGKPLIIHLLTTESPAEFKQIADFLQKEWLEIGVYLDVEIVPSQDIFARIQQKSYDILLYGQSLEYNFDTFPYWHSSQSGEKGLNLSNLKNFQADALIEEIRNPYLNKQINVNDPQHVENERSQDLEELVSIFEKTVPAVFLYRPIYYYVVDNSKIKNIEIQNLNLFSDRFSLLVNWYINEGRKLNQPFSFSGLLQWMRNEL